MQLRDSLFAARCRAMSHNRCFTVPQRDVQEVCRSDCPESYLPLTPQCFAGGDVTLHANVNQNYSIATAKTPCVMGLSYDEQEADGSYTVAGFALLAMADCSFPPARRMADG